MSIPKIKDPVVYRSSDKKLKVHDIIRSLRKMGYDADDARSAVNVIERYKLDKSQFNYPYDSFDEFKKHVLTGEFDINIQEKILTKQERKELDDAVKEGRLWITY